MKVLHVVPDIAVESGGQSTAAIGFCEGLVEAGVNVGLLTTDYLMNGQRQPKGIDLHVVPCGSSSWRWSPTLFRTLRALLDEVQVVHLHGLWLYPIWAAARLCRSLQVPYVLTPCGMLDGWSLSQHAWKKHAYAALLEGRTIRGAAALHFTAEAERVGSRAFGSCAPTCVVPIGLSRRAYEDLPPTGAFRRRFPEVARKQLILFLGRLHYKKCPGLLLQAFSELVREFPEAVLALAGPGEARYVSDLHAQALGLGLDGRVVFTGLLQGRAVQEALVDADIFVLPSLHENFGLAVAEAMAAGCPVVVSPEVALAPEIERYGAGVVVDGEVDGLRNVLRQLLCDEARRHSMGQNGRRLILSQFTWDRVSQQMLEVYEDILRGTRLSSAWR